MKKFEVVVRNYGIVSIDAKDADEAFETAKEKRIEEIDWFASFEVDEVIDCEEMEA